MPKRHSRPKVSVRLFCVGTSLSSSGQVVGQFGPRGEPGANRTFDAEADRQGEQPFVVAGAVVEREIEMRVADAPAPVRAKRGIAPRVIHQVVVPHEDGVGSSGVRRVAVDQLGRCPVEGSSLPQ